MRGALPRLRTALAPEFEFLRELAAGGMGVVWLLRERRLDRLVVLKTPHDSQQPRHDPAAFLREARLLAQLEDPRIVRVYRAGEADGVPYCVMEHVAGGSLEDRLRQGPLPLPELTRLGRDLLGALAVVHAAGVSHRDIKPANILWLPDRAMLADFGLATGPAPAHSRAGGAPGPIGSPAYWAPEQSAGGEVGPAADLYSAAAVLYEAATGRRWSGTPDPAGADWSGVPSRLRRVLVRGLAWAPTARWSDALAFRRALLRATPRPGVVWRLARLVGIPLGTVAALVLWWLGPWWRDPPRQQASDLAILKFSGCAVGDTSTAALQRYLLYYLDWFPEWRVVEGGAAGARWHLGGEMGCQDRRDLLLTLHDSGGAVVGRVALPVTGDLQVVAEAAADSVAARLWPNLITLFRGLGGPARHPVEAARLYFQGEEAFGRDDWVKAEEFYRQAFALDSTFGLAAWRLMLARQWRRVSFEDDLARLGLRPEVLPPLQRRLVDAASVPDVRERIDRYARIVAAYPHDPYAALFYANEMFARGPLVGAPLDSGIALMREWQAEDVSTEGAPALDHLAWGYIRLGRRAEARRAVRARINVRETPGAADLPIGPFLLLAYWERFHPRFAGMLRWYLFHRASERDVREITRMHRFALTFDLPDAQAALAQLILERSGTRAIRRSAFEGLALARMAGGRAEEALAAFDSGADLAFGRASLRAVMWCVVPNALGLAIIPSPKARGAEAILGAIPGDDSLATEALGIAALAAGARGERGRVGELLVRLDSLPLGVDRTRWKALVAGEAAALAGDPQAALRLSEPALAFDSGGKIGGPFLRSATRLRRAAWWEAAGQLQMALRDLRWYQNTDLRGWPEMGAQAGEVDAVFGGLARLQEARLAVVTGDLATACPLLARLGEIWAHADTTGGLATRISALARKCP